MEKNVRKKTVLCALMMLILANAFTAGLNIFSFQKLYISSIISVYKAVSDDLPNGLHPLFSLKKPHEKSSALTRIILQSKQNHPELSNIAIALPKGKIIYSADPDFIGRNLPDSLKTDPDSPEEKKKRRYAKEYAEAGDAYHILSPLKDKNRKQAGILDVSIQKAVIRNKCNEIIFPNLYVLTVLTLSAAMLLILYIRFSPDIRFSKAHRKGLYMILFLIIGGTQIVYSFYNAIYLKESYSDIIRSKSEKISLLLAENIRSFSGKDMAFERIIRTEAGKIISANPEIGHIGISDKEKLLYLTDGREGGERIKQEGEDRILPDASELYPLTGKNGNVFFLHVRISQEAVNGKIRDIFLDIATVLLISFVFITELFIFMFIFIDRHTKPEIAEAMPAEKEQVSGMYALIRPAAFIYQLGQTLPFSFIPLHAKDIYTPVLALPGEFVIGLPVSVNMLCATIAFLTGGPWLDRKGWQSLHFWGILLTSAGALLCSTAQGIIEFTLYRGLVGFGYGFMSMSYMGFVYANTGSQNRTVGFANINAAMFSGHLCGGTIGGMLAERIGFSSVFLVSFLSVIPTLAFPFLFMRHTFQKKSETLLQSGNKKRDIRTTVKFLLNRNIFSLLFFLSIPSSIVFIGLLYYLCPIYLDHLGLSQANIARLLMINGLFMIYLSPLISPAIDRSPNKRFYLAVSGLVGSIGLLSFYCMDGIPAMAMAIVMISLSNSIGFSSRTVYALEQKISIEMGGGKAMGIYRTADRMGWVMGPPVFGMIIASVNMNKGLVMAGAVYLILTILFIISSGKE